MNFLLALWEYDFLRRALLAALLSSVVCGVLGSYIVIRRGSYMVGAVSHSMLGGIGLARWCQVVCGLAWFTPILGAVLTTVLVSCLLSCLVGKGNAREDTVLSAIWTAGVALGLCFIAWIPGYAEDLNSYLFGNILLVGKGDLLVMLVLAAILLVASRLFHTRFLALCFQGEVLSLRGISPMWTGLVLNLLVGLAVVVLSQMVGIVMVLALLVLPAAAAARVSGRLSRMMVLGGVFCFLACFLGMFVSYTWNIPAGAVIILCSTAFYLLVALLARLLRKGARLFTDKPKQSQ